MSIISRMRKQKAVWWKASGLNRYGQPSFLAPAEIDCRWDDSIQEFIDDKGVRHQSKAVVYVDREMSVGDYLKLTTLEEVDEEESPADIEHAFEILRFDRNPNLRATEFLLTAYL